MESITASSVLAAMSSKSWKTKRKSRNTGRGLNEGSVDAVPDDAINEARQLLAEQLAELEAVHGSCPEEATWFFDMVS